MVSRVGGIVETKSLEEFKELWEDKGVQLSLHRMENFLKQRLAEDDLPLESVGTGDKWVFEGRLGVVELACAAVRRLVNFTYNEDIYGNCSMFDQEGLHFLQGVAAAAETFVAKLKDVPTQSFFWHPDEVQGAANVASYSRWRAKFFG
ncbi:MAG: hypothetical protein MHM6MM_004929 [Cercozoa sp. M6MM]